MLPRVAIPEDAPALADLPSLFAVPMREVWLEIGFGGGEHLAWQAKANPNVGFLGCEPFEDGVIKLLGAMELEGIANIRMLAGDARPLLRLLPRAGIGRIFILFPDPTPRSTPPRCYMRRRTTRACAGPPRDRRTGAGVHPTGPRPAMRPKP
jgi:tRNA (guanine-N7-)-methyltransferase